MGNVWFDRMKRKITKLYLKETGTKFQLMLWLFITGITMLGLIRHINYCTKEAPQNQIKIEKTGNFETAYYTSGMLVIVLTNGEKYSIFGYMFDSARPFYKDEFFDEVKQDDELHFVVWESDEKKYPSIYQLECNGKEYLSYKGAIREIQKGGILLLIGCIFIFLLCSSFFVVALFRYTKAKYNKENSE